MLDIQKTILVTGASKGIGEAISWALLETGYKVIGVSRHKNIKLCNSINFIHESIDLNQKDLSIPLLNLYKQYPQIDGLICNAGKGYFGSLEEFSFAQIQEILQINLVAHIFLTKIFLPHFKRQKKGDFIFIGSESALQGRKKGSIYSASKFALRGFIQSLREECANDHIRVSLINPGMVNTAFFDNLSFAPGDQADEHILSSDIAKIILTILDGRLGINVDEINLSPQRKKIIHKSKKGEISKRKDYSNLSFGF